ncbi:PREDICTED: putative pentatricopeptide repeat-containing protein At1g77010, mitochondrial isoform X1 [Ipomoea nil]|uniref:putative pentatricopeptide repeat-containing protein At1g77010, mitochondrial isoform X1 n=2 Tax=Ipomoea nil TaxID=35883 RepID=UPI0009012E0B|nr:PREDICTED: putative pentatricopeptide repeat-containing protein At1g77010, mitochondrial isoform X1 [Ipomoea nil]
MDIDLQSCARSVKSINTPNSLLHGKMFHLLFLKRGVLNPALTIANRLIQMYARCGQISDARKLFDEMPERNYFTWNTLLEGYMKCGMISDSLRLFSIMPQKNDFSWNVAILGLVNAGELDTARRLSYEMPRKNAIAWNALINGFARTGFLGFALRLFREFSCFGASITGEKSCIDPFVLTTVVKACMNLGSLRLGKQIHAHIIVDQVEIDSTLASSLVNMYGKGGDLESAHHILSRMLIPDDFSLSAMILAYANCGRMKDARQIFDVKTDPCVVLWNSMITGYVSNGDASEAFFMFDEMHKAGITGDSSTLVSVLSVCSSAQIVENCQLVHAFACKLGLVDDLIVASALIDTYAKCGYSCDACKIFGELKMHDTILLNSMITIYCSCGRVEDAKWIFESMPHKSLISWNAIIGGLCQNGLPIEALDIFCKMNKMDIRMDRFSCASMISSCASISSLDLGEQFFARAIIIGIDFDQIVSTSILDLYCKCGLVKQARKIFDQIVEPDEASWNSMLMGYATNGYGTEALNLFSEMRCAGVLPTNITFTGVLSACNHCGLLEEGKKWFNAMRHDYHTDPGIEHYSCMVDLYVRAGCLEEAMNITLTMPFEADASIWSSILRGCVAQGNEILGKQVAKRITELDPENSSAFAQLSSIYATSGKWERSALVLNLMKEKGVHKIPGQSRRDTWI